MYLCNLKTLYVHNKIIIIMYNIYVSMRLLFNREISDVKIEYWAVMAFFLVLLSFIYSRSLTIMWKQSIIQ